MVRRVARQTVRCAGVSHRYRLAEIEFAESRPLLTQILSVVPLLRCLLKGIQGVFLARLLDLKRWAFESHIATLFVDGDLSSDCIC